MLTCPQQTDCPWHLFGGRFAQTRCIVAFCHRHRPLVPSSHGDEIGWLRISEPSPYQPGQTLPPAEEGGPKALPSTAPSTASVPTQPPAHHTFHVATSATSDKQGKFILASQQVLPTYSSFELGLVQKLKIQ